MGPTRIMVIRHAEKPVPDKAPGLAADGSPDPTRCAGHHRHATVQQPRALADHAAKLPR